MSEKENGDRSMPHPCALDRSLFADSPPHACRMLEVVASIIESERERLRPILGKGEYHAGGLFRRNRDMVDSMDWEDLLLRPDTINRCLVEAGVKPPEIIEIVLTHCQPQNTSAFTWMHAFYKLSDNVGENVALPIALKVALMVKRHSDQLSAEEKKEHVKQMARIKNAEHRERADAIKKAWASGKYRNREICADEEWEYLKFNSRGTARDHLKGTPNPDPWPAKGK